MLLDNVNNTSYVNTESIVLLLNLFDKRLLTTAFFFL